MLTESRQVKIMDFGLAKLAGQVRLTKTGTTVGTPAYMSPEQIQGIDADHRSDIWSFGVVLYEILTGQLPFRGEFEQAVVYSILNKEPQPPHQLRQDAPLFLSNLVLTCLEKAPTDRFQHMNQIIESIRVDSASAVSPERFQSRRRKRMKRVRRAGAALATLAVLVPAIWFLTADKNKNQKSIAVLPFQNLSPEGKYAYFADGITEDIQTQISRIGDLRVIASLASRKYRNTDKPPSDIASELEVHTLLTGSVRRLDEEIRITCQLVEGQSGTQLWGQTFDLTLNDIFVVESNVTNAIAGALGAEVLPAEQANIARAPTENLVAYEHLLKGYEAVARYTKEDNELAIDHFKSALELDSAFVRAWAGLASAYVGRFSRYGFEQAWVDSAARISQHALALDPNSAEAHTSAGLAFSNKGWIDKALLAYQRALECNPNYHQAMANLGFTYKNLGQYDLALRWYKKAEALEPTGYVGKVNIGVIYSYFGDFEKADAWFQKAIALKPGASQVLNAMAHSYLVRGEPKRALAMFESMRRHVDESWMVWDWMADVARHNRDFDQAMLFHQNACAANPSGGDDVYSFSRIGLADIHVRKDRKAKADSLLHRAEALRMAEVDSGAVDSWLFFDLAVIQAIRGEAKASAVWLERAVQHGWCDHNFARRDPLFERVIAAPEVQAILSRVAKQLAEMHRLVDKMNW
jgi:TolB-like protein/Flp pilus assembly protein TadD